MLPGKVNNISNHIPPPPKFPSPVLKSFFHSLPCWSLRSSLPAGGCCRPDGCKGCSPQTLGWKAFADGRQMRQNTNEKWLTNKRRKRDKHKKVKRKKQKGVENMSNCFDDLNMQGKKERSGQQAGIQSESATCQRCMEN